MEITSLNQIMYIVTMPVLALLLLFCKNKDIKTTKKYETSRTMSVVALFIMGIHFVIQFHYRLRLNYGDDVSALVNMLFYSVVTSLICLSMTNLLTHKLCFRKMILPCVVLYICLIISSVVGLLIYESLHIGYMLVVCGVIFFCMQAFSIFHLLDSYRKVSAITDDYFSMYANQFIGWIRLVGICFLCLCASMPIAIFFKVVVNSLAPLLIITLMYYVARFITFGGIVNDLEVAIGNNGGCSDVGTNDEDNTEEEKQGLPDGVVKSIKTKMDKMIADRIYCDSSVTLGSMALQFSISEARLSTYINIAYGMNFNRLINSLRIEEAKRLITAKPNHSIESIAEECGFKSRNHFHRVFKDVTNMTPKAWKESH